MSRNNSRKVQVSPNLFSQIYDVLSKKNGEHMTDQSETVVKFFNEVTSKLDECMYKFRVKLTEQNQSLCFVFSYKEKTWKIAIPTRDVEEEELWSFLMGKISFQDFLALTAVNASVCTNTVLTVGQIVEGLNSWDRYCNQLGYGGEKYSINIPDREIKDAIDKYGLVWYYGTSCSGKTCLGIQELKNVSTIKVVYNPCFSSEEEYDLIKLLICYGEDIAILLDDLQFDTEKAKELFLLIESEQKKFRERHIRIFIISWVSLLNDEKFSEYQKTFHAVRADIGRHIIQLQNYIPDKNLKMVCGKNLALLNIAVTYCDKDLKDPIKALFRTFVKTSNLQKVIAVYKLCVLGSYEYLIPKGLIGANITADELTTIKKFENKYYAGHKEICRFLVEYIENNKFQMGIDSLPEQDEIICEYIQGLETKKQWRAIKQLIGEQGEARLQSISPIWSGLSCFETAIQNQTKSDPTWGDAPSSMYFVLKVASLLGILPEYKVVLENFCKKFEVCSNQVVVKYDEIATTNDFYQIRKRMISEDENGFSKYETGTNFDCKRAHKNRLLGLIVGLKDELYQYKHEDLYRAAISDLFAEQNKQGGWYPTRIPWITARILIGLSQAGFTVTDEHINRGVSFLLEYVRNTDHWEAHTGGWNTPYETSSLCLEAIYSSEVKLKGNKKERVEKVINYLFSEKKNWMRGDKIVDGSATACCLLKNYGSSPELINYIQNLCKDKVYSNISKNKELNLEEEQSCQITQVAWYTMDFCWDVLYTQLPKLLNQFVERSLQERNSEEDEIMKRYKVFISYSEDSDSMIIRVKKVSAYLRKKGYTVWCYADEEVGSNTVTFMQKAPTADVILVLGSKTYKAKSLKIGEYEDKGSGVFFENLVFSQLFIQNTMEKIVPILFETGSTFEDSFPPPFNTNKGLNGCRVTKQFLDNLAQSLKSKLEAIK